MKFSSALLVALTAFTVHAAPLEGVESIEKRQTREGGYTNVMNNLHVIRRDLSSLRSAVVANGGNANTYDGHQINAISATKARVDRSISDTTQSGIDSPPSFTENETCAMVNRADGVIGEFATTLRDFRNRVQGFRNTGISQRTIEFLEEENDDAASLLFVLGFRASGSCRDRAQQMLGTINAHFDHTITTFRNQG